LIKRLNGCQ